MSLNFDLTKIKNGAEVCYEDDGEGNRVHTARTQAIIWMCLHIGIGEITERNAEEYWTRTYAWETALGASMRDGEGNPVPLTLPDVRAYVGLTTNVFPKESEAAFAKKLWQILKGDAQRKIKWAESTDECEARR